ncbi:competence protein CoiA family protein [Streptomyces atratus]|uniref:competence protein CoiA family protein n=1 Tax=Streptomyces atratus TaxID=1893 RepID=UPI00224EA872|nr:competence protein CoiA family protein [Streptomyces atratus]MCX5346197.1 competence protein CoiA family protein [Streptomyces atratus]
MPFIALHPEAGRVDATQPDLGAGLEWSRVYKASPRVALTCPECTWGVHAKHSPKRVRFFCHDGGRPPECSLANESWEHHMLKLEMAGAIRAAGWFAELEVAAADGSWRADVMATSPDSEQRMAWEAQLSPATVEDIAARTGRYAAEGVSVCWVSPHKRPPVWLGAVPSVRVRAPEGVDESWVVDDGLGSFVSSGWFFQEAELAQFVRWVLRGQLRPWRSLPPHREVTRIVGEETRWFVRDLWWASRQSAEAQSAYERERKQRAEDARRREARRQELETASRERRKAWLASPAGQKAQRRRDEAKAQRDAQKLEQKVSASRLRARREEEESRHREVLRERRVLEEFVREQELDAQRQAALRELELRAHATGERWWALLSRPQVEELFRTVVDAAWRRERVRVRIPEGGGVAANFAYGVPVHAFNRLYGIVRPCPELLPLSPQLIYQQVFARDAEEARALEAGGLRAGRITHFGLAGHEPFLSSRTQ